jgi:hypothetical protein
METIKTKEETKAKKGRPIGSGSKLTLSVIEIICKGVRLGMSYKSAAIQAGVKEKTFAQWMEKARVAQCGIYADLMSQMTAAIEDSKAFHLSNLRICAQGEEYEETKTKYNAAGQVIEYEVTKKKVKRDPSCSKWMLERRFPEEFGNKIDLTSGDEPFKVTLFGAVGMGSHGEIDE